MNKFSPQIYFESNLLKFIYSTALQCDSIIEGQWNVKCSFRSCITVVSNWNSINPFSVRIKKLCTYLANNTVLLWESRLLNLLWHYFVHNNFEEFHTIELLQGAGFVCVFVAHRSSNTVENSACVTHRLKMLKITLIMDIIVECTTRVDMIT